MLSDNQLNQYSRLVKIDKVTVFREYLQLAFLLNFYRNEKLKHTYFKGGSCLRLIFGSGRFSEDLDFSSNLKTEEINSRIAAAVKELSHEFSSISVKPIDSLAGISRKIQVQTQLAPFPTTIKLDFSDRDQILDPEISTPKTDYPFSILTPIPHLSLKEILAEKVRSIMSRNKGRDLYDLYYLLARKVDFDPEFIQKKLDFYKETYSIDKLIKVISEWDRAELKNDLGPFLPADVRKIIPVLPDITVKLLRSLPTM
jgi:predicted nucleotidyltransferase component of viral defense system